MSRVTQTDIAKEVGINPFYFSRILTGQSTPSWDLAKRLGKLLCTGPEIWMEGDILEMRTAVIQFQYGEHHENCQDQ